MVTGFPTDLFDVFYYAPETSAKPPWVETPVLQDHDLAGSRIDFALAGVSDEDVTVSIQGNRLLVEVDNSQREDIPPKFRISNKTLSFEYLDSFDLDAADVSLENGMLSIYVPIKKEKKKKLLFGKSK